MNCIIYIINIIGALILSNSIFGHPFASYSSVIDPNSQPAVDALQNVMRVKFSLKYISDGIRILNLKKFKI